MLGGFAILAIAVVAAFNVNVNMQEKGTSSIISLEKVEALAQEANGCTSYGSGSNDGKCTRAYNEAHYKCEDRSWYDSKDCKK